MLAKLGIVLLLMWLAGHVVAPGLGSSRHLLLLSGLLLLLLGFAKTRDAATKQSDIKSSDLQSRD